MTYAEGTRVRAGRTEAVEAVRDIAALIAPTLGPAGSDVLVSSPFGEISTTNDGATILRSVPIEHPAARIAADIALTQERAVGDGTTSAVVLASKLLDEVAPLVEKKGLRSVLEGLERAQGDVEAIIEDESVPLEDGDLARIVSTALSGKGGEAHAELIAELLEASLPNAKASVVLTSRSGAPMRESKRIDGLLIDRLPTRTDMPRSIRNAKILLMSAAIEAKQAQGIQLTSTEEIERYFESEENASSSIAKTIIDSGANVVITRKGIDDAIQYELARAGIIAIRRVSLERLESIAYATRATIVPNLSGLRSVLGRAGRVHVDDTYEGTIIEETPEASSTIMLRGSTEHVAQELERAAHDALGVVRAAIRSQATVPGALTIETRITSRSGTPIDDAIARAFASLAKCVLAPAGIKSLPKQGIDVRSGREVDARDAGIIEPVDVKRSVIAAAFEITRTILRVETIVSLPDPRNRN